MYSVQFWKCFMKAGREIAFKTPDSFGRSVRVFQAADSGFNPCLTVNNSVLF